MFCRETGIIRGIAKGAKREKGAFSGGIELLTRGELGAIIKPERDLATLTDWNLKEVYPALHSNLQAHRMGMYLADITGRSLATGDPHPVLFDRITEALRVIGNCSSTERERSENLMWAQMSILDETGYRPELEHDVETGEKISALPPGRVLAFIPDRGGIACNTRGDDRWLVRAATVNLLRDSAGNNLSDTTLDRANRLLAAYLRHVLGCEPPTMLAIFGENQPYR